MCIERVKAKKVTCCMQTLFSGLSSSRGQLHILSALYKYKAKKNFSSPQYRRFSA